MRHWPAPAVKAIQITAVAAFCVVNAVNALHKGGDFDTFLQAGDRFLTATSLYDSSAVGYGITWPPFVAMLFAPLAAVARFDTSLAKIIWYVGSLAFFYWGVRFWVSACRGVTITGRFSFFSAAILLPLLAVSLPVQTNFEHQNLNPLLLLITGAAALAVSHGGFALAGTLIGLASALKVFPALVIAYFAFRRLWTSMIAALLTAAVLTVSPVVMYGLQGWIREMGDWIGISLTGGWPIRGSNQSLFAAIDRIVASRLLPSPDGWQPSGNPLSYVLVAVAAFVLVSRAVVVLDGRRSSREGLPLELATVVLLSVLLSPIAWIHYWMLLFPAFFILYNTQAQMPPARTRRAIFWVSAVLTSGLSRLTVGVTGFGLARMASVSTVGALLLFFTLLSMLKAERRIEHEVQQLPGQARAPGN